MQFYNFGATSIAVGLSAVQVVMPRGLGYVEGFQVKKVGTGGTLFVSGGSLAANIGVGYLMGDTETLTVDGPAQFFLSSVGATTTVGILVKYGAGYSSPI